MQMLTVSAPLPSIEETLIKEPLQDVTETPIPKEQVSTKTEPLGQLSTVDRLAITRRLRVRGVLFFKGKKNRFLIRTSNENLVYTVEEENSWWISYFCYGLRPMQLLVRNSAGEEVMRIDRPYACTTPVLPFQLQNMQVFSPPGERIGSIEQEWTPLRPKYIVKRADGEKLFRINGPMVTLGCFRDIQFHIQRMDGTEVGKTCKRWEGLTHALFYAPVTDRFGVVFERALQVQEKALLLAASLLMNYMYYDT